MPEKNTPNLPSTPSGKFLKDDGTWAAAGGGSFSGTMDDITDGVVYVKTENNYSDSDVSRLANTSGTNTGDQNLSGYFNKSVDDSDDITEGATKLFLTSAERTKLTNTSGTNSGDNAVNSLYSGLAASKQDTLVSGTNIKTINGASVLGSGDLTVSASATGILLDKQFSLLQSDGTLNAASGVQTWAGTNKTGQDVFTVAANTTYLVEGQWFVNTGATTHTTAMAWALATATVTDFQYQVLLWSAAANTITTTQSTVHVSGVASKVLNATSTAVWTNIQFKGIMVIGTGGTVTPQINFSANPTGSNLMKRGSWTSFTRLGVNTVTTAGGWA
jgi:hypothetical protein